MFGLHWLNDVKASRWYLDNPDHKTLFNNRIRELALRIAKEKANQSKTTRGGLTIL